MLISNSNFNNNHRGFTIVELVVVLAGLAALASFSIPPFYTLGQTYISTESPIHAENNGGGLMSVNCSIRKLSPYN